MEHYALQRLCEEVLAQEHYLAQQLLPEHFADLRHRTLFGAVHRAWREKQDALTLGDIDDRVSQEEKNYHWLEYVNGATYLGAPYQIVTRLAQNMARREAERFQADPQGDLPAQFTGKAGELADILAPSTERGEEEILAEVTRDIQRVPTGYGDMDKLLYGGIPRGGLFVIAARTGVGKTTLAVNICSRAVRTGKTVCFLTMEMPESAIYSRFLQSHYGIDRLSVKGRKWEKGDLEGFRAVSTPTTLPAVMSLLHRNAHRDLLVVDYFQLISSDEDSVVQQLEQVSHALKNFAMNADRPVIVIAQLNRNIEAEKTNREPQLSDIRGCGALEQDADVVSFLWDKNAKEAADDTAKFGTSFSMGSEHHWLVKKNRDGPHGDIRLTFDPFTMKFTSVVP